MTCPFHSLAFEIECSNRASKAAQIIHQELGRGHSNYPKASHNILTRFRSKDKNLQHVYYAVSTNLGLLQSNMSWLYQKHGNTYHWIVELFRRLRLPIFDGMVEALQSATEVRAKNLSKKKTVNAKERRTQWKKARAQEQQERKLWSRRQRIEHTYGSDDDDCSSEEDGSPSTRVQRKCKCGSVDHRSIRHHSCPLNRKRCHTKGQMDNADGDHEEEAVHSSFGEDGPVCTCGTERASHHRDCALNP